MKRSANCISRGSPGPPDAMPTSGAPREHLPALSQTDETNYVLIAPGLLRPMWWTAGHGIGWASPEDMLTTASEYWVSKAAGDLLALAPRVAGKPGALRRAFRDNVDSCLRRLFHRNGAEFAKFVARQPPSTIGAAERRRLALINYCS